MGMEPTEDEEGLTQKTAKLRYDEDIYHTMNAWMLSAQNEHDYRTIKLQMARIVAQLLNEIAATLDGIRTESRWEGDKR